MKLLTILLAIFIGVAEAKNTSGGGSFEKQQAYRLDEAALLDARINLAVALLSLTPNEQALVTPADLTISTLKELILNVPYRSHQRHKLQELDGRARQRDERLLDEDGRVVMANALKHKIETKDLVKLAKEGHSFSKYEIYSLLSPIIFDFETLQGRIRNNLDLIHFLYFIHLRQLGKTAPEAERYVAALNRFVRN